MRAILEFDLPSDQEFHKWAVEAPNLVSIITDLDNHCRNALKHGHDYETPDEVLETVRDQIREAVNLIYDIR